MRKQISSSILILLSAFIITWSSASAQEEPPDIIETIIPAVALAGSDFHLVVTLKDLGTPPVPPEEVVPTAINIGSLDAQDIARDGSTIMADFSVPDDMKNGKYPLALTFTGPNGDIQFTRDSAFEIKGGQEDSTEENSSSYAGALLSPVASTKTYFLEYDGKIINEWECGARPALSAYLLGDKSLLRTASLGQNGNTVFGQTGGAGGKVQRYAWDGELIWEFEYSSDTYLLHHDIEYLPNGNILMIAWEYKSEEQAIAAGRNPDKLNEGHLWPDMILEVKPEGSSGGQIVWQWRSWDHIVQDYDDSKDNYGTISENPGKIDLNYTLNNNADWLHCNAIDYNQELDQIMLTSHNFSEIWIIDHSISTEQAGGPAGDLLYRWGNPTAWSMGGPEDQILFVPHDGQWIDEGLAGAGDILVFNNGNGRPYANYSSVDQFSAPINENGDYALNENMAYGPSNLNWSYEGSPPSSFYADHISGAQRLRNGNTLICSGPDGRYFEADSIGNILAEYTNPFTYSTQQGESNALFRARHYNLKNLSAESVPDISITYPIVDSGQEIFYDANGAEVSPAQGDLLHAQDAGHNGYRPYYTDNEDGTVTDNISGLMWQQSPDINVDGIINADDKLTLEEAIQSADVFSLAGYNDWRLPTIKELYSLIMFYGQDPSGYSGTDTEGLIPFINTIYFDFGFGDVGAGERIIDAQFASSTTYVGTTMNGAPTMFGVNFADGRIKGYPYQAMHQQTSAKTFYILYVRGNSYGENMFEDNNDGTVTDHATGLMWQKNDSESAMDWLQALQWAADKNAENYLGHNDWRLPNAKELQSIVDYSRAPAVTNSPAIDPMFICSEIVDEGGELNYPYYWSSTTHANMHSGSNSAYVAFGQGLGFMSNQSGENYTLMDVHGAGCQRSDPKQGNPADYPYGHGPQGDVIRIYNYVRLVRDTTEVQSSIHENDPTGSNSLDIYNYPNPFSSQTTITINVSHAGDYTLTIYDIRAVPIKQVNIDMDSPGSHNIILSADGLNPGIYFCRLAGVADSVTLSIVVQ